MRRCVLAIALTFMVGGTADAQQPARPTLCFSGPAAVQAGLFSGSDMTRMSVVELRALIAGFINGITASPLLGAGDDCVRKLVRGCFADRELDQFVAMVRAYLTRSPSEWHEGSNMILYRSLIVQCVQRP